MAELLPSPQSCCSPCPTPIVTNIPGVQGDDGAAGADGANGVNAFTTVTSSFNMPLEGEAVTVTVGDTSWMAYGQKVFIGTPSSAAKGTFEVTGITDATHAQLTNIADTATGAYIDNAAPGTLFPAASKVSPSGLQGPAGSNGTSGAPDDAKFIVQESNVALPNAIALKSTYGVDGFLHSADATGLDAVVPAGVADDNVVTVDDAAGLTLGRIVAATANGIKTPSQADARTALGLGDMAVQDASAVNITGGTITGVTLAPPSGLPRDYLLFQQVESSGTDGGTFTQLIWNTVPLNTEVKDTGGNGSIAANQITLATGTYRIRGFVLGNQVDAFQSRLYNITDGVVEFYGTCDFAAVTDTTIGMSVLSGRLTVAGGPKVYEVQANCQATKGGDGFGVACAFGNNEIYSTLELEKETT